jgi:MarR family transcriptional regulator, organic hydroperoxide resistance regulator
MLKTPYSKVNNPREAESVAGQRRRPSGAAVGAVADAVGNAEFVAWQGFQSISRAACAGGAAPSRAPFLPCEGARVARRIACNLSNSALRPLEAAGGIWDAGGNVEVLKHWTGPMVVKVRAGAPPHASPAARELWRLLVELSMSAMRERFIATVTELDLSPPQAHALKVLRPGHPIAMRELADGLHCDPSNITGIVDRLEGRGLVERRPSPADRRIKILLLTGDGERLRARLLDRLSEPPAAIAALSADEQRQLRDLLRRIVAAR